MLGSGLALGPCMASPLGHQEFEDMGCLFVFCELSA